MTFIKTTQIPATAENKMRLLSLILKSGSKKPQNPAGVDSGTHDPWPPLLVQQICHEPRIHLLEQICNEPRIHLLEQICHEPRIHLLEQICNEPRIHLLEQICNEPRIHLLEQICHQPHMHFVKLLWSHACSCMFEINSNIWRSVASLVPISFMSRKPVAKLSFAFLSILYSVYTVL